jgi:hypothetical protein
LPQSDLPARAGAEAVGAHSLFLHTSWRSGGTWLWSRCREQARVRAFYEPLHEQMADLRLSDIGTLRPQSWHSNHSDTPPYFEEYRGLLRTTGRGVDGFRRRFALNNFFMSPMEEDAALAAYVDGLVQSAAGAGCRAVLKFCRSMGRVGWFEQHFPDAVHAVVMRDPVSQWRSSRRLMLEQRNRYFMVAPLLVLARNARHPLVEDAVAALGVRLPALHSDDMAYGVETVWRHVKRLEDDQRYRGFLAFWTACALGALQSRALLIDSGAIGGEPAHRAAVEQALEAALGEKIGLSPRPSAPRLDPDGPAMTEANEAAAELCRAFRDRLTADRLAVVLGMLGAGRHGATVRQVRPIQRGARAPEPAASSAFQRLATRGLVLLARGIQPVRRLHGAVTRKRQGEGWGRRAVPPSPPVNH